MMLQRDCNAGNPADLAASFSHVLDLIMSPASVPGPGGQRLEADDLNACTTGCARAIEFYRGTLTEPQTLFVQKHSVPNQADVLYWDEA